MASQFAVKARRGSLSLFRITFAFALSFAALTILVGVPKYDQDITIHSLPLHFGKILTGVEGGQSNPTTDIPRYLNLYQKGKLKLKPLITHRYPLAEINIALDKMRSGEVGRCVIRCQSNE